MIPFLLLVACQPDHGALDGEWVAAFYRAGIAPVSSLPEEDSGAVDSAEPPPACEGDVGAESFRAWLRLDSTNPVEGEHLTLYPDGPDEERPEASNGTTPSSAMAGLVVGAWQDGVVQLDLVPDLDYPLATDADRDAWREHHLQLQSTVWGDRCWTATWAWVDASGAGAATEQGLVYMRRQ